MAGFAGAFWKHVVEDAKVRERLASLETDNSTAKAELKSLRERVHDLRDDLFREFHQKLVDWKENLLALFGRGK
jgi:hypothetical protein